MDKIERIKRFVESLLDTSFGGEISIVTMEILPTQKYDEETKKWIPDTHSIFLNLKNKRKSENNPDYYNFVSDYPSNISKLLESLLGFECVVDFV